MDRKSKEEAINDIKKKYGLSNNKVTKKSPVENWARESVNEIGKWIWFDIFLPRFKTATHDALNGAIDILFNGSASTNSDYRRRPADSVSYRRDYNSYSSTRRNTRRESARHVYSYDTIEFNTKSEAEKIIMGMEAIINSYGVVRVSDYYDLCGESCEDTAYNYGWDDLSSAYIIRSGNSYIIKFPRPVVIE